MLNFVFYTIFGFFGLIFFIIVIGLIFGKKVDRKWEFEADFINERGREIGEFDIDLKRYPKEQTDYQLVAKMFLRHKSLRVGRKVDVLLDEQTVMHGVVSNEGSIRLGNEHLVAEITDPKAGQVCLVQCEGHELCRALLKPD